jgi:hypothetical protein
MAMHDGVFKKLYCFGLKIVFTMGFQEALLLKSLKIVFLKTMAMRHFLALMSFP